MPTLAPSPAALRVLRTLAYTNYHIHASMRITPSLSSHLPSRNYTTTPARRASTPFPSNKPSRNPRAPSHADRGPKSTEDTQTDFSAMDIFNSSSTPQPANSIDACTPTGFHLSNGTKTTGSKGVILVGGEAFDWSPWSAQAEKLLDKRGLLHLPPATLKILEHLYPRPDLLVLGTGDRLHPIHPSTREYCMSQLGIRVDVMDTANASATYNLLARERGLEAGGVGAALFPIGWRGHSFLIIILADLDANDAPSDVSVSGLLTDELDIATVLLKDGLQDLVEQRTSSTMSTPTSKA